MRTKVSTFCDKAIEAGWLLALIIAPLFFNVYSSRVFEPDKLSLVRSIATLMAAAWLIKWAERTLGQGNASEGEEPHRLWGIPLVLPTTLLALVYVLATIASVVPRISLWGSYQRLQGTYTTLSYIVIFLLMLQTLRRVEQLRRLVTVVILTSFPIALYGLLQHYGLDPLPWGGNVSRRVASHMGNAIFISAYLIMIAPLILARIIHLQRTAFSEAEPQLRTALTLLFILALLLHSWVWFALGFGRGLITGALLLTLCALMSAYLKRRAAPFLLMGGYGIVLSAQLVCIVFSQSRGPLLGIAGGLFFFGLLYAFLHRRRTATAVLVGAGVAVLLFLIVINIPSSPLARVRDLPYVGRLGRIFEIQGGTGRVRMLIWEGAVDMITADQVRTMIGYGPEAMYVAYNPFYPPDLAHYEKRNASPDRSHNETFDALVTTGVLGFVVYMFLFTSIFYYGLHWLGLIRDATERRLFIVCSVVGGALGLLIPLILDRSLRFAGVGLPMGFIAGIAMYVMVQALSGHSRRPETGIRPQDHWRALLSIALFSSIVAHFVEIHFGIAIAATRTYFWSYIAIFALLGQDLIAGVTEDIDAEAKRRTTNRKKHPRHSNARSGPPRGLQTGPLSTQRISLGILIGFILITMVWDYTTNPLSSGDPLEVLVTSLTTMAAKGAPGETNFGLLWLATTTFVLSTGIAGLELAMQYGEGVDLDGLLSSLGIIGGTAAAMGLIFALIHAARLGPGVEVSNLIYEFYTVTGLVWLILGTTLHLGSPRPSTTVQGALVVLYPVLLIAALFFIDAKNIRPIKADSFYKQGLRFDNAGSWDKAIYFYEKAVDAAPREDFYYLFRGRAFMEKGKTEKGPEQRDAYFSKSLESLQRARKLNPLNTDHTANLARLHRTWAELEDSDKERSEKLQQALQYYEEAAELSPHNAQIYNEWGLVYYLMGEYDKALQKYQASLELDKEFVQTYMLIGDVHIARKDWHRVVEVYEEAVAIEPDFTQGWSAIGYAYSQRGEWEKAIQANKEVLAMAPKDYGTLKNVAILYSEWGRPTQALAYAQRALELAPKEEKQSLESFIQGLRASDNVTRDEE
ncbi:MAG: tetratricopeptide repeat protein [Chloroflexota bacterium]|nr:tetratricopeptide repeat protein [Chloroflexota bacterium]